jgi:hypothetical protein
VAQGGPLAVAEGEAPCLCAGSRGHGAASGSCDSSARRWRRREAVR